MSLKGPRVITTEAYRLTDFLSLRLARDPRNVNAAFGLNDRLVFVHIEKASGTSIRRFLYNFIEPNKRLPLEFEVASPDEWPADLSSKYRLFAGHFNYSKVLAKVGSAHCTTFLRDPVQRVISYYYQYQDPNRTKKIWEDALDRDPRKKEIVHRARRLSLDDWVRGTDASGEPYTLNGQVDALCDSPKLANSSTINHENIAGLRLRQAKHNLEHGCVCFGLTERFRDSIQLFCYTFGLPGHYVYVFEHLNARPETQAKQRIDDETIELIKLQNKDDYELYSFAKDLFDQRCNHMQRSLLDNVFDKHAFRPWDFEDYPEYVVSERKTEICVGNRILGHGFYHPAQTTDGYYYLWTGKLPEARLDIVINGEPNELLTVEILVTNVINQNAWETAIVLVNDHELHHVRKTRAGRFYSLVGSLVLAPSFDRRLLYRLVIKSSLSQPDYPGCKDQRFLGIALHKATLSTEPNKI